MAPAGVKPKSREEVFGFLDADQQRRIAALITEVTVEQDRFLFEVGSPAGEVFFLHQGRLSVLKQTGFHGKMQVVAILEPGALVSEAGFLPGHVHGVSVRAIERSSLYRLTRGKIEEMKDDDPQLAIGLMSRLVFVSNVRLEKTTERLARVL